MDRAVGGESFDWLHHTKEEEEEEEEKEAKKAGFLIRHTKSVQ